ncbi:LCP family protein [Streptomyces sp. A3M-1-3]|uniref:LCP family protein n=1 Tax=Streptomyces sp. A3M-1-3 TaxID=2962044 RepID=UPI0020B89526|nr:LCP family protein [Streptomyces sp. A3M-1-3]MCP3820482.1 LCP family protein [Streptomyces sp. A3M-1-3]
MDAQGRGRADEIDPADQWVLNPDTGNYELRLDRSVGQPSVSRPRRAPAAPSGRTTSGSGTGETRETATHGRTTTTPRRKVPGPRRGEEPPPGGRRGRKRKPEKSRRKKALLITGGAMAFVLVGGSVGLYAYYKYLDGNINTIGVGSAGSGGFKKDQAVNILLIGTDKRTGSGNEGYGDKNSPGHADTTILFHVSKDRTNATAVSIPRDLITDIPDCPTQQEDGSQKVIPGQQGVRFNTSLGQSGRDPGCTMRTVRELTGLTVDNFMMADFNAIKTLTTAVGGVEVCVAKDVNDKDSKLKLTKGTHTIEGEQALAFVRTRHSFGNESDLDRIQTQQQFLSSLIRKMKSEDTLTSPTKLMDLAEAGTKALTVDDSIGGIKELAGLAGELAKVNPKNITFTTLPVIDNPAETVKATVVVNESKADPLFAMMRSDTSLTEVKKKEKAAKSKQEALLKGERAEPSDVRVDVYNGGGPAGSAQTTLTWLQNEQGVPKSSNLGNAPAKLTKTTLEYAPNQADQARALADMMGLPASAMKQATTDVAATTPMTLTLGEDFEGAGIPLSGPTKAPKDIQQVQADKAVCSK